MIAIVPRLAARHWAGSVTASIRAAQRPTVSSLIATRPLLITHRSLATASESKSSSKTKTPAKRAASTKKTPPKKTGSSKSTTKASGQTEKQEKLKLQKEKEQKDKAAAKEKEQKARVAAREKEQKAKAAARAKEQKAKAAAKEKEQKARAAAKAATRNKWDLYDESGKKVPLPTANKPTRQNAFMFFVQEQLPKLRQDPAHAKSTVKVTSQLLGQQWNGLSDADKQKYTDAAAKHNATYKQDEQAWRDSLSPLDLQRIQQFELAKRKKQKQARRSLMTGDDPKPKRPLNTLFRFLQDARQQADIPKDLGAHLAWTSEQSATFRNLSPEQKQPYADAFERDMAAYRKDLDAWKQRQQAS